MLYREMRTNWPGFPFTAQQSSCAFYLLPVHEQFLSPGAQRLHRLVVHVGLLHDWDDFLANAVEDLFHIFPPSRTAEVVTVALVGPQELVLHFFQALDFRSHLIGQFLRDHGSPPNTGAAGRNHKQISTPSKARIP